MIIVRLNRPEFEYDIHSLVKAFYPKQDVSVTAEEKTYEEPAVWEMQLSYLDNSIRIAWWENGEEAAHELPGREFSVDFSDRSAVKNTLKQNLYEMLSGYTGESLPWGTLTGIRPTKIPMKLLEEGADRDAIASYMKETYLASDEKIRLSIDIAERELKLLSKIDYENGYSLYIGIPFCPTTCLYCSFTSYPLSAWAKRVDAYLDALEYEIDYVAGYSLYIGIPFCPTTCLYCSFTSYPLSAWAKRVDAYLDALEYEIDYVAVKFAGKRLNAIYIGGGTPTTLEPYQLDRLIRKIKCSFDLSDCLEFTVEAGRPDSITREKLLVLRRHGISRISINPQTMKDETLRLIGRHHTVEQTRESFLLARELGFDNINMDLILGLPGEDLTDVRRTMEQIRELKPDNITVHSLALKRAARLNMFKENYKDYRMVNTQEHMELVASCAREMGLSPYYLYRQKSMAGNLENVGYAAHGKAGVYNILIMEEKQTIVACGAGSITKRVSSDGRIERCENVKDVALYIEKIDEMIDRKRRLLAEK